MERDQVVVEFPVKRLPHLNNPDWVAFEYVLRNLSRLNTMPLDPMIEGLYGFAALTDGLFTAEQILDEIIETAAGIRDKVAAERVTRANE